MRQVLARGGYTIVELLVVLSLTAIMLRIGVSRLNKVVIESSTKSAAVVMESYLGAARAAAIRRAQAVTFRRSGHSIVVTAPALTTAGVDTIMRPMDLYRVYTVSVSASGTDTVSYTSKGQSSLRDDGTAQFVLARGVARDTVCINDIGSVFVGVCR